MDTRVGRLSEAAVSSGAPGWTTRAELFAGRHEAQLGKPVGVSQFGVNHVILDPGAFSSLRHWHEGEDEFAYVLWGELTLIDENGEHRLAAGDFVGFPAGVANGHHLANRSAAPAAFLVVGLRRRGTETLRYPDDEPGVTTVTRDENGDRAGAQDPGAEKPADTRSAG
jgi:uncharacterized cupin superfamily protein